MTVFVYLIIFYFLYLRKINEKVPTGVEVNSWTVFHIFWEKENRFSPGRVVLGISTIPRLASCLRVADKHTIHSTVLFCVCFYLITVWWVFFFFAGEDIVLFCFLNFRISGGRDCYHIGVFLVVFLFFFWEKISSWMGRKEKRILKDWRIGGENMIRIYLSLKIVSNNKNIINTKEENERREWSKLLPKTPLQSIAWYL